MKQPQLFQKPMLLLSFLFASSLSFSQVSEQWVKRYNGSGNGDDRASDLATDAAGNVYVAGSSRNSDGNNDYITIKYDAAGNERWVKRYNGAANSVDDATSLAVDAAGNVYVTGSSRDSAGYYGDCVTVKYDTDGDELWVKRYNGPADGDDYPTSLAVDASGNVYIAGSSYDTDFHFNYVTIKYDAAGNEHWVRTYGGTAGLDDKATALAVDSFGNVYVTGESNVDQFDSGVEGDYATVKYDAAGNELWVRKYDGIGRFGDFAKALAVDTDGNAYVTGQSDDDFYSADYVTIKYDSDGNERWVSRYDNPLTFEDFSDDAARALAVDANGNVYVTGASNNSDFTTDYATVKYDTAGNELWVKRYKRAASRFGLNAFLAVDAFGNVYVSGTSRNNSAAFDYATIKYDTNGNELWTKSYNGSANNSDEVASIAIDASGNVYVTGSSDGTGKDYATIKYSQTQASAIISLTLINADNEEAIRELKDRDTLNLATLPSLNLNIRANTNPATVGSVVFKLSGAEMRTHTENIVPYALFADDNNGDYYSRTLANGNYTLTATPYSAAKGSGEKGTPLTFHFTVIGTAISNLILVNAETDQDIKTLQNGDVIDISTLPTSKLNIRAVVHPDTVGSVVFNLNNRIIVRENYAPYAIGGDIKGDYRAWTLPTGHHTLTATPHEGKYGRGKKGKAHSVSFTVVAMSAVTRAVNQQKSISNAPQDIRQSLKATPNPFSAQTTVHFSVPQHDYIVVQVYDGTGNVAARLYQAWADSGKEHSIPFDGKQLSSGVYVLKLTAGKQVQTYKLVLIR